MSECKYKPKRVQQMADELLLRTSLQREREEIAQLQSQLRQQQQQQKTANDKNDKQQQQQQFVVPQIAHSNRQKLDLAEQQRRLLLLQQQQQQFQQQIVGKQQQEKQQQDRSNATTFTSSSPSNSINTSSPSLPSIPSSTTTSSMGPSASIAAAYLLAQHQSKMLTGTNSSLPQIASFPLLFHSLSTFTVENNNNNNLYGGLSQPPNSSRTSIIGELQSSPCSTPAYHYQLAAPKPIQPQPVNNFVGQFANHLLFSMANHQPKAIGFGWEADEGLKEATSTTRDEEDDAGKRQGEKEGIEQQMERQNEAHGAIIKTCRSRKNSNEKKDSPQQQKCSALQGNWSPSSSTTAVNDQVNKVAGEINNPPHRKSPHEVPVYQISPQQLHLAMQQFFRSQQQSRESFDSGYSISSDGGGVGPSSPKRTTIGEGGRLAKSRGDSLEDELVVVEGEESQKSEGGGEGIGAGEEYVDVVGDGEFIRSSQLKLQRKAHIEFYRKLKSFRNRGDQLDCQLCSTAVPNTDASIRSHVHGHCKTALFVCKLCQRGFQDQHLVFEHIGKEHPVHRGTQFIEDRRDMGILMDLLTECFPRVLCRTRDCLFEAIGRLTASAEFQGQTQLECRLCSVQVAAQKNALYGHLNQHPSYKCKRCKFSCIEERGQLEHQRREHPGGLEMASSSNSGKDRTYCVSLAFDVLLDTLKCCFPLEQIGQSQQNSTRIVQPTEKVKAGKKATTAAVTRGKAKKIRGRKRKHKDSTGTSSTSADDGAEIVFLGDDEEEKEEEEEEAEEECSWTKED